MPFLSFPYLQIIVSPYSGQMLKDFDFTSTIVLVKCWKDYAVCPLILQKQCHQYIIGTPISWHYKM